MGRTEQPAPLSSPTVEESSAALRFLYGTALGRLLLRPLICPTLSRVAGAFLDSPLSRPLIGPFLRKNGIDLSEYESDHFACFNDCFSRRIKPGRRPVDPDPEVLIAPSDGLLTVWPIRDGTVIPVKQSRYTLAQLLDRPADDPLVAQYQNGLCLVFRLCVHHYHRYCFVDSGTPEPPRAIPGRLHTVRPIALAAGPVFVQNSREYTLLHTAAFGDLVQMEVGALLVGRIANAPVSGPVRRGQEKGTFLYGGSTILLLVPEGRAAVDPVFLDHSAQGLETPVKLGQPIGRALPPNDIGSKNAR